MLCPRDAWYVYQTRKIDGEENQIIQEVSRVKKKDASKILNIYSPNHEFTKQEPYYNNQILQCIHKTTPSI